MWNKDCGWLVLMAIISFAVVVVLYNIYIPTGGDRTPIEELQREIDRIYNDNGYLIIQDVGTESYLLVNKKKEAVMETGTGTSIYTIDQKSYTLTENGEVKAGTELNPLAEIESALQNKSTAVLYTGEDTYELRITVGDSEVARVIYSLTVTEDQPISCRQLTEDKTGARQFKWAFSGYQSLPDWSLDAGWYTDINKDKAKELFKTELAKLDNNILTVFSSIGDTEADWNVDGEAFKKLPATTQSLYIDDALLYLQNYNMGFVGSKQDLLRKVLEFYDDKSKLKHNLYTAIQYVCSMEDWLIAGVSYTQAEEVVQSGTEPTTALQ